MCLIASASLSLQGPQVLYLFSQVLKHVFMFQMMLSNDFLHFDILSILNVAKVYTASNTLTIILIIVVVIVVTTICFNYLVLVVTFTIFISAF